MKQDFYRPDIDQLVLQSYLNGQQSLIGLYSSTFDCDILGCMDESLLQTKLYIPVPRSGPVARVSLVHRPPLKQKLNEGLSGKLTLISAPAGFGKTTLVSSWLEQVNLPVTWLSLDEDDNGFARYCSEARQNNILM